MGKRIYVILFIFLLVFSSCKKSDESNISGNSQQETISEQQIDSGKQNSSEDVSSSQVDISKQTPATVEQDNKKIKQNVLLTYNVEAPKSSNIKNKDSNLKIVFSSDDANPALVSQYRGKEINNLIKISPEIKGQWVSSKNGKNITFIPSSEWSADTKYSVTMDKSLFNTYYKLSKLSTSFKTEPFTYYINSEHIDNDFSNNKQQYTLNIKFNYLFNQKQFKKEASLLLNQDELKFKINFDKDGYGAKIISNEFPMVDDKTQVLMFSLPRIDSASGSGKLLYEISHSYVVEKISEGARFYLDTASAPIVRDEKNNPRHTLVLTFSEAVNMADLIENLKLYDYDKDVEVTVTPIDTGNNADVVHSFKINYDVEESTSLYLVINKNLKSVSGIVLRADIEDKVTLDPIKPTLGILQKGTLLSLISEKNITFESRGASALDISVGKILPEQIQHIITFSTSKGLGDVNFNSSSVDETNFSEYKNAKLPLSSSDKIYPSYATINIADYLGGQPGLYYIKAASLDKEGEKIRNDDYDDYDEYYYEDDYYDYGNKRYIEMSKFILITDMYIIAKSNKSNMTDVFIASISKGEAVKNAQVQVIGKNGLPIVSGQTDGNGHFQYELSKDNDNSPIAIVAKKDNDFTYLPFDYKREIEYSKFDIGGEYISNADALKAMVFTDRGIYRPGEDVNIASIIKDTAWKKELAGVPVEISITSPKDEVVLKESYSLDSSGFFETVLKTQPYFTTGNYYVRIYLLNNKGDFESSLGAVSFELKEFDTDTMRVNASVKENKSKGWIKPDKINIEVKADNMIGTPAANRRVKSEVAFVPTRFYFPELKKYSFTDPYLDKESSIRKAYTPDISDTQTNEKGIAQFDLSELFTQYTYGTYLLEFNSEVFEAGSGDGVTGYTSVKISPADYLVGYTTDSYLYFLNTNEKATVNFIAVDSNLNKISKPGMRYRVSQITYSSQLIKDSNGRYRYSNIKRYNVINSGNVAITEKGTDINLPTNIAGDFVYEIINEDNMVIGKVDYYVAGNEDIDTSVAQESELLLKLDKEEYKAGDTVNLSITAPYSGYGLITVEKEKVYTYKWFKSNTNTMTQSIKIPNDLEGNGYINVTFVRDIASKDIFTKPLSYAVMPFTIDKSKRKIDIALKTPEIVMPGDNITVEYSAAKNGKIIVYGADEGILQVAGYKLPDPLNYFMRKVALSVRTIQTADLILPDYNILSDVYGVGGGENAVMADMAAKRLNPFARVVEKPAVFWSKIIDVKAGDKNKYTFTVPSHFNGSMKVMAVAVSKDGVGSSETAFISRSPVVLTPNMPYAAVQGDKFRMSVGITNLIGKQPQEDIKITAVPSKHFQIIGDAFKTVTIKEGGEALVIFDVVVTDELGSGDITLKVENKNLEKPLQTKITSSIRPVVPYRTEIAVGSFKNKEASLKVPERNMHNLAAKREVMVSANPLYAVAGIGSYLKYYPYGCTEQITSKIYPVVMLATTDKNVNTKEVQDVYDAYIKELTSRQKGKNGFTYWNGGSYVYDLPAIYATQFLIDARELGYNVPNSLYNNAIDYLKSISNSRPEYIEDAQDIAFATYLLARNGVVSARALNVLEDYLSKKYDDWESSLTAAYMGATYVLYKNEEKGRKLLESSIPAYTKYLFRYDFDDSLTNTARYIYLASRHAPDIVKANPALVTRLLDDINEGYYNSFSSAFSFAALYGLGKSAEDMPTYVDAGKGITVDKTNKNKAEFSENIKEINVSFKEKNPVGYYYHITTTGYDKNLPSKQSNGLSITKSFYDKNGKKITSAKQGDEVTVSIKISRNDSNYGEKTMIAVTDLIPGGTEILTKNGVNVPRAYEFHEFREDRAIIYLNIYNDYDETITYRLKMLSSGEYFVPPAYGESLYNRDIYAVGNNFSFTINDAE